MIFDPAPFADATRISNQRERERISRRREEAIVEASRLAESIRRFDPEVRAVRLFGSVADGLPGHIDFDIDLAVSGGDIYKAMDAVSDSVFAVDVVDPDRLPKHMRERILRHGIPL